MHPVSSGQNIGRHLAAVLEARGHGLAGLPEAGATSTEVDGRGVELGGKKLLQLGSVDGGEAAPQRSSISPPGRYISHVPSGRLMPCLATPSGQLGHAAGQSDRLEDPKGVGPQADACPHLLEYGRLLVYRRLLVYGRPLVHLGIKTAVSQGDGGDQPADSAADDGDLRSQALQHHPSEPATERACPS